MAAGRQAACPGCVPSCGHAAEAPAARAPFRSAGKSQVTRHWAASALEGVVLHHPHDRVERLDIPHRVVDGIVVMGCPPEPLPALRVAPVPVEAGPEVTDAAARVPEWIVHSSAVEHASYPLPVVGGIVAHKDKAFVVPVSL